MNTKTAAIALGVAGVLLVAGLATLFTSTPLSELLDNNKGTSEGSNSSPDDNQSTGPSDPDEGDGGEQPTGPVTVDPNINVDKVKAVKGPLPEPIAVQGEPRLNIAYLSGTSGNNLSYGMPTARSGPYSGWDDQNPAENEFRIETIGYGPDQPDGPTKIALFIQVDGIGSRWVGASEIPEGTVEVRTFPENADTPRLVNLFNDGAGNCKGILVSSWSVFDHSFVYEQGVTDRNLMTFSLDITRLGSYDVKVWAVHDHGDGNAVQVSNMVSWTVHVDGSNICRAELNPLSYYYANGTEYAFTATVHRNTEPDDDNVNVRNTIAYTGTVHNYLLVWGAATIRIDGAVQTGTVQADGWARYDLGAFDFSDTEAKSYYFTMAANDGQDHPMTLSSVDAATGTVVGNGSGGIWHQYG